MFTFFSNWRRQRLLARFDSERRARWQQNLNALAILDGLTQDEQTRLLELGWCFLHHKRFTPVMGTELTDDHCIDIALMAALPVLNLGLEAYGVFHELLIYPEEFVTDQPFMDDNGVEHQGREELAGEAWEQGPVLLSLSKLADSRQWNGYNLVIHELAHKLDMANGGIADGLPALPAALQPDWLQVFPQAYADQSRQVSQAHLLDRRSAEAMLAWDRIWIDPYGAENQAEFFAVCMEAFFTDPIALNLAYPPLYQLLRQLLQQDPIARAPHWQPLPHLH
ncbi:zinc-dependent peptidase [Ferrimonas kyonanensis]|uniref:M90 family metallopeptidase n=1 Tax=Ferrimonas kyonanensis TaxID=364763 RepID=UPI0003FFADF9|nr:M90 family metallopeptidase [Ferrimonas kyonanensis]